jgi:hypothetical protein
MIVLSGARLLGELGREEWAQVWPEDVLVRDGVVHFWASEDEPEEKRPRVAGCSRNHRRCMRRRGARAAHSDVSRILTLVLQRTRPERPEMGRARTVAGCQPSSAVGAFRPGSVG